MAEGYWRYNDGRQPAPLPPSLSGKRPRPDYDIPPGHELPGYYPREDERGGRVARDTESIGSAYDRYLRSGGQAPPFSGGESGRSLGGGGMLGHQVDDPRMLGLRSFDPGMVPPKSRDMGLPSIKQEIPLPPDASNTLFVEGLPANCTRREVSHIFRPFVGFKEVRLVSKESRHSGGDPLVLCFVDFINPAQAATALDALQGYKFDEHDRESAILRLQFARYPGPRSGGGSRGGRR
ncbi:RNA-binding protein 1-like [Papaver somniferum]|uniref:RNA-binding protein 1-like n=1 Tax=Papaver somniferum TaxID=3469 RepID=UPI000E6FDDC8|nr:RNA-binding protein 1-like [Papaver somniferum]XP_026424156.1 RNA-binding protein 1-like [Papaver somniferum]